MVSHPPHPVWRTRCVVLSPSSSPSGALPDLGVYQDIHAVSSALKLYLRELPVPLVAYDVYNLCLIAARE